MTTPLSQAVPETCGGKAGALGALLRAGLPVPDGFVVTFDDYRTGHDAPSDRPARRDRQPVLGPGEPKDLTRRPTTPTNCPDEARPTSEGPTNPTDGPRDPTPGRSTTDPARPNPDRVPVADRGTGPGRLPPELLAAIAEGLGDRPVAVRSSAPGEDSALGSAAGQHDSVLAVRGLDQVAAAVRACWDSLHSTRAVAYRASQDAAASEPVMAVLVQRLVDADVSGVMFTPASDGGATRIEAAWGLGPSVVAGAVTPDAYDVAADGSVTATIADKPTRLDRDDTGLVTRDVAGPDRHRATLDDAAATGLARLGRRVADVLGGPQDVEWALVDGRPWVLQARPVTADLPPVAESAAAGAPGGGGQAQPPSPGGLPSPARTPDGPDPGTRPGTTPVPSWTGTPASPGTATGPARIVRGPDDFGRVRPGDVLVCPHTDPAWTPLLRLAAGVVTEVGGVLSHAAIVARERRIPAVLGVPRATTSLDDGQRVVVDGSRGTVTPA